MNNDLVKRLRSRAHKPIACTPFSILMEAADRIEELDAKVRTAEEIGRAFEEDAGQLRANMTWQPIETAPKDGTEILLWEPKGEGICIGCYYPTTGWNNGYDKLLHTPTHWMPLPEEPK